MKKNNLWRIIWIVGIYAILVCILYLVVDYKVKWENKDLNTYLYFYNCSNNLCTSTTEQLNYYNRILCEDDVCPFIKEKVGENLILHHNNKSYIYNYLTNEIIDNKYVEYNSIRNNFYVARNGNNRYGVIDNQGNVLIDFNYEFIDDYKNGFVSIKNNGLYGIVNEELNVNIDSIYEDVVLINKELYSYKKDGKYYITSYDKTLSNNKTYDYVYATDDVIFVISDKTIDILSFDLKSKLIMKLNTFYSYKVEKERSSLKINYDSKYLYFTLFTNENEFINYIYDLNNNKIL